MFWEGWGAKLLSVLQEYFFSQTSFYYFWQGVDTSVTGVHSHSPDSLASKMTLKYAKDKNVKAEVNLKNKSDKQLRMNGDVSLSFPGEL